MAARKKMTAGEYFEKNTRTFISFSENFAELLNDRELIRALAEKDLEKLAKVWKIVFELLSENAPSNSAGKLAELIGAFNDIGKEERE